MPNNDVKKVKIGGVTFSKSNVKSAEVIVKDGKKINSVFLKDGTHLEYPTQKSTNKSYVSQKNHVEEDIGISYGPHLDIGPLSTNTGEFKVGPHITTERTVTPDKETSIHRIKGVTVTGTENKDRYYLYGCNNSNVDVSQDDGKEDRVRFYEDSTHEGSIWSGTTTEWSSKNNKVKINDSNLDKACRGFGDKKAEEPQIIKVKKSK